MTTVKPIRQDLSNTLSLTGTVGLNPVFGIVAPVAGQVRYLDVATPTSTPTKPTRVANIYVGGKATPVEVPAGATFAGRLLDDRSTVDRRHADRVGPVRRLRHRGRPSRRPTPTGSPAR